MNYKVTIDGKEYEYPEGTSFEAIAKEHQKKYDAEIVLVSENRRLRELRKTLSSDCTLVFLTTADAAGQQAYRRSLTLLLMKAVR